MRLRISIKSLKRLTGTASLVYCLVFTSVVIKNHFSSTPTHSNQKLALATSFVSKDYYTATSSEENDESSKRSTTTKRNGRPIEQEFRITNRLIDEQRSRLFDGRVINELCKRILFRAVAQSNVLIVAPDIISPATLPPAQNGKFDWKRMGHIFTRANISKVIASSSVQEGHITQVLPARTNLNKWSNNESNTVVTPKKANWYLLSYFISGNLPEESIDVILHPSRASELFNDTTLTYIVIGIHSSKNKYKYEMKGLTAVKTLLDLNYKVQLLASSHLDGQKPYRPNYLFKSKEDVEDYLTSGADTVQLSINNIIGNERSSGTFDALLFATQGLDLAIPSRLSYVTLDKLNLCENETGGRCDSKIKPWALGQEIFLKCPEHHHRMSIDFDSSASNGLKMKLDGQIIGRSLFRNDDIEVWMGHKDIASSEVACVRALASSHHRAKPIACTTRILRQDSQIPIVDFQSSNVSKSSRKLNNVKESPAKLNFISILIDPISRNQFKRSLPNTFSLLEKLDFDFFDKYTVVGDNSGPNQAALFSGMPLIGGREGIKSSSSHKHDEDNAPVWLWDELGNEGYATLKAEDVCIKNSNMVQSLKPATTHGQQLYEMFCFDFDRPNCLGKDMAAEHVFKYAHQFMTAYGIDSDKPQPWAAFLSLVDSHEDSLTLISYLDEMFVDFLQSIDMSNTMIVFSSDHGLHYGPSFYSNGERERAEPILYLHIPNQHHTPASNVNKNLWVTPFDVHETILDATMKKTRKERLGNSLLHKLPDRRKKCLTTEGIPEKYCNLLQPIDTKSDTCTTMVEPPSVHSFYADILQSNRPSWPQCQPKDTQNIQVDENTCKCAVNQRPADSNEFWIPCDSDRFRSIKEDHLNSNHPLSMKTCQIRGSTESTMEVNISVQPKTKVRVRANGRMRRYKELTEGKFNRMPNILFIEIDSLSDSAASRHLRNTRALLESHKIITRDDQSNCPHKFCAAIFEKSAIIGQNSIPNQLASLSGCTDWNMTDIDSYKRGKVRGGVPEGLEAWCPVSELDNPWLYSVAGTLGYVTFFGEEFCYSQSPWVVQHNLFKLNPDYAMNDLFCQLAQARVQDPNFQQLYSVEYDTSTKPQPCVDGRSRQEFGFEYLRGIWQAYPNLPKFAYLNALAAHDYSVDLAYQSLGIEAYDYYLSNFLEEMLNGPDASNTVIILRSDHGLQGGPAPIDFSTQVEHMNPFTSIIFPKDLHLTNLGNLQSNQDKLITGYDIYNTIRGLMAPRNSNGEEISIDEYKGHKSGIPKWSYNLLRDKIPSDRTCKDAKIPNKFCPCVEERNDLMPYFYVGQAEQLGKMEAMNFTEMSDDTDDTIEDDATIENAITIDGNGTKRQLRPRVVPGHKFMKYQEWKGGDDDKKK